VRRATRTHGTRTTSWPLLYEAVRYALDRQQTDGDFGYYAGFGTETFYRLVRAEAAYLDEPVEVVQERRGKQHWRHEPRVLVLERQIEELAAKEV
jgi:hypothetical protein